MTSKDILLEQFSTCFDKNGWFVAVRNAVDGITARQASWRPDEIDVENTIWQILNHLTFYNYAYLVRFQGREYEYSTDNNDETFAEGETEDEWQTAIRRFDNVMKDLRDMIEAADETKFDEQVSKTDTASWATLISNINAHNAYHAGQILLLRKLAGSWDRSKGVS